MARYIHSAIPTGYVFHANGVFHIRYYVTELINGKPERIQNRSVFAAKTTSIAAQHARRFRIKLRMS